MKLVLGLRIGIVQIVFVFKFRFQSQKLCGKIDESISDCWP